MNEIKSNSTKLVRMSNKHKLLLFGIIAIFAIALALPASLSFANETTSDNETVVESNGFTISGRITKAGDPTAGVQGQVQAFGVYENIEKGWSSFATSDENGYYSINDVPEGLIFGAMIGAAPESAWQFLSLPSAAKENHNFSLSSGATWAFPDEPVGLDTYAFCGGTYIVTADGYEIPWTSIMPSIPIGGMPEFGLYAGSTISESRENKTLTYHYKSPEAGNPEEYTLVFVARADKYHKFEKWQIDGKDITEAYKVKAGEVVNIAPIFSDEPDPPVPGEVRAYLYEDSARPPATPIPITNGYAYIVGISPATGETFVSDYGLTDENGLFKINISGAPEDMISLIVVGAPGHTNRAQYFSTQYPATNFYLSKGVQCTVDISKGVEKVWLEKGSNIQITLEGYELQTLELPEDVDFTDYILPFGMSYDGTFNFMDNGELNFSFDRNSFDIGHLSLTFKVVPKEGYELHGWLKDGQKISGEYKIKEGEADFTIAPDFGSDEPEPEAVNAQTSDSLSSCIAALAFMCLACTTVFLYTRLARKKK